MFYTILCLGNFRPQDNPGDVRLVGGAFPSQGLLEVYHNGEWKKPCADGFGDSTTSVVCTQLGYNGVHYYRNMS